MPNKSEGKMKTPYVDGYGLMVVDGKRYTTVGVMTFGNICDDTGDMAIMLRLKYVGDVKEPPNDKA